MYLALGDKYGNIVGNDNSAKVTIRLDVSSNNASTLASQYPALNGASQFVSTGGTFEVAGIGFTAKPGYSYTIRFETDGIDETKPSNQQYLAEIAASNQTSINFETRIELRECSVGEAYLISGKCEECAEGKSYSLV